MNKIIHRADTRGKAEHGWLHSRHTFSFASYMNRERMHFGMLRVLNDDVVEPGAGFGMHPHDNMEIISIPLAGILRHSDSMGNTHVIQAGDVQIMSAGTGLLHSEYNASANEQVNFLQIWVIPGQLNVTPRYGQVTLDPAQRKNRFQTLVSPEELEGAVRINQDAYFSLATIDANESVTYLRQHAGNGIYVFVIDGKVSVADETLAKRDAIGLTEVDSVTFTAGQNSEVLVIEVRM